MRRRGRREFLRDSLTLGGLGLIVGCGAPPFQAPRRPVTHRVGFLSFSVGVLWDRASPATSPQFDATRIAAGALGLELRDVGVRAIEDVEGAVEQAVAGRADALFVIPSTFLLGAAGNARIIDLVARHRRPKSRLPPRCRRSPHPPSRSGSSA